ncbi:mannose-6-phosphate isomerase type 1 [Novosphingobium kunmingense]|uniref:Mannose-6-phosphate isomerase type 1 n=2 Tax=Novosphingobium kunmingense TaxID=1211806 RepID=A0A2N0H6N6_9SPHN|nr:mannose-6-phosphate isomerase type 1 [Novosphingobium kunmingense]
MTLPTRMVEKPWGKDRLPPPFETPAGQRIGEVWFEPPAALSQLLIKYIFTSEKLSVQVHPSDAQTLQAGLGKQGKEECWLVIAADEGAMLGIGFDRAVDARHMRRAACDGAIEGLMTWFPVKAGDFFYIPANTVHAIGAGVSLIEVQQNSDITYRLYDYGRPRELHLDDGIAVARGEPYDDPRRRHVSDRGEITLVDGPLFRLVRYDGPLSDEAQALFGSGGLLVVPIDLAVAVDGAPVSAGACELAVSVGRLAIPRGARGLIAQPIS